MFVHHAGNVRSMLLLSSAFPTFMSLDFVNDLLNNYTVVT